MELTIEKLVYGGDGLGRTTEGEVIFVPGSAVGDRLEAKRVEGSAKPAKATVESILAPSTDRVEPRCSVFGSCGGCQWQHINVPAQRDWKRRIVAESLERIGKLQNVSVLETIASTDNDANGESNAWAFRNRVQWEVGPQGELKEGKNVAQLGYYQANSHEIVEFEHCHIIPDSLNELALWLRASLRETPALAAKLRRIEVFTNRAGEWLLTLTMPDAKKMTEWLESIRDAFPAIQGILWVDSAKKHPMPVSIAGLRSALVETLRGHSYHISAGSFFQTNLAGAEAILSTLEAWVPSSGESLLDVYSGVGLYAVHFHSRFQRVVAVESAGHAMMDAAENMRLNQTERIELKTGDARRILPELKEQFEVAIVNPPRSGCQPEVLNWLAENVQKELFYVSCNPTTLARDLKTLAAAGWQVQAAQPVDMFPQTYHIETVVHLSR